ncbi:DNA repair protein RadC [candidate division KSB3 bacterium]|uniref:DNA repair protein RadC n=1 Tax=candidate division KSB3 bacterium TaxID=2044937 RepID=A0A9D5JUD0_9BACT|nr:DNA repair protein RadC [candidate division KSB3 bacterium]MBD3324265.1 DNA repair protein RadC [candidate division KSB3 bacterium]
MDYLTIKEMPKDARPRERLEQYGPEALSNQELLAITLSTGSVTGGKKYTAIDLATQLLRHFESLKGIAQADFVQLQALQGIGPAKACQIMAAFELGKRVAMFSTTTKPVIRHPTDIFDYFRDQMSLLTKEVFRVVALDTKNRIIRDKVISEGTLNASIVHPRDVFRFAVVHSAATVILLHNHPSGDSTPSQEDLNITRRLVEAGKMMDIQVLDHIIIAGGKFTSMKERSLL